MTTDRSPLRLRVAIVCLLSALLAVAIAYIVYRLTGTAGLLEPEQQSVNQAR